MTQVIDHEHLPDTLPTDFESLINAIPACVARIDCNMRIVYANNQFLRLFGYDSKNSDYFNQVVGPQFFNEFQRHLGRVLTGDPAHFMMSFENADKTHSFDVSLTPQFDHQCLVTSIIFHGSDITERVNDERALHDYYENATIGLHWVDANGVIVWANPAELKMLGYKEDEYKGHHISRFHKDQHRIKDILHRLANGEILRNYEAEMVCKDGSIKCVSINSSVLWEKGKFVHTRCFTIDITAEKLATAALKESEQRFRTLADLLPLVIWTSDENGLYTFLNSRWTDLTGRNTEDGTGNRWLSAVHADDRANIQHSWNRSVSARSKFEAKLRMLNAAGEHTVCFLKALPHFDSQAKFLGHTGTIQDFTSQEHITTSLEKMVLDRTNDLRQRNIDLRKAERALKAQNEELEKINHELSSFAHVASHDLQEPLRKIQTFSDRVLRSDGDKLSEQGSNFIKKIDQASARMRRLIQDILTYAKAGDSVTPKERVDMHELVEEIISEFEVKIEEKNATIQCSGELPVVEVVKFQFHQVFLNLLSNALKFSRPGIPPFITISSSIVAGNHVAGLNPNQNYHAITIADNGIGFETKYSDQILGMFSRLHSGSEYEGSGIGLAICKKIIERHGGRLFAHSELGKGATFHVYVPCT